MLIAANLQKKEPVQYILFIRTTSESGGCPDMKEKFTAMHSSNRTDKISKNVVLVEELPLYTVVLMRDFKIHEKRIIFRAKFPASQ